MNLRISWIIAAKDLKVVIRKKSVRYTIIMLPLLLSVLFPLVIRFAENRGGGIRQRLSRDF